MLRLGVSILRPLLLCGLIPHTMQVALQEFED